jgi:tRNA(Ile2) C34 agmatinyltransferase TiaS
MSYAMKVARRGALFYVVHSNGKAASVGYARLEDAEEHLSSLAREAQRSVRICLSCQKPFESEGSHNRRCNRCKSRE